MKKLLIILPLVLLTACSTSEKEKPKLINELAELWCVARGHDWMAAEIEKQCAKEVPEQFELVKSFGCGLGRDMLEIKIMQFCDRYVKDE